MKRSLRCKLLVLVGVLTLGGLVSAQEEPNDPPVRVARLQFTEGQVSMQPGGVDDWVDAMLNRPLTTSDRLWTDRDSRAELSIASAAMRMGSETSLTITNLDDNTAQFELDQGTLSLSVRYMNEGDVVEVDTPNVAFTVSGPGEYRFDVYPDNDQTWIQVRRGGGQASGQNGAVDVPAGQLFQFSNGQSGEYTISDPEPPDSFDEWSDARERRETSSRSAQYVAAGTIGYESLDDYGNWQPSPEYGEVWYPNVAVGWAPYHEGHWAWVGPWGWTWVDDEPWGFAPFHYGRWVNYRDRWGWVPGPRRERPVYAPALVAWIGGGPSFGVSIGIGGGGVGWVALGWHDPYFPSYHVSPDYARRVNISNTRVVNTTIINNYYSTTNVNVRNTTITNVHYENVRVRGAALAVPGNAFAAGRPVAKVGVAVSPQAAARASFVPAAHVVPTKQAVLGGRAPAAAPARLAVPRQVVAKTPPPPPPVKFDRQRPLLEKSNGMPLSKATRATLRASTPAPEAHAGRPAVVPATKAPARPPAPAREAHRAPAPTSRPAPPSAARPGTPPAGKEAAPAPRPGREAAPAPRPSAPPAGKEAAPPTRPGREAAPAPRPSAPPAGREAAPAPHPSAPPAGREAAPPSRPGREAAPAPRPSAPPAGREATPAPRPGREAAPAPGPSAPPAGREATPAPRPGREAAPAPRPSAPPAGREATPAPRPGREAAPAPGPSAPPAGREATPAPRPGREAAPAPRPSAPRPGREAAPAPRPSAPPAGREAAPAPRPGREAAPAPRPGREAAPAPRPSAPPARREAAPPARPPAPPARREAAPPARPPAPPARREAAPPQQRKNAPSPKEKQPKGNEPNAP